MSSHVEEICTDLFRIEIPLPDTPLKYLNSYIVRSPDRNLIIDTGFNSRVCLDAMRNGLETLKIDLSRTDIFITHFHADHISLVPELRTPSTCIYFNRPETELLGNWQGIGQLFANAPKYGFPESDLLSMMDGHPGSKFEVKWATESKILSEGDILNYGDYRFICIETPGHTPGHICLYEPDKKILISGDHILNEITPNILSWIDGYNPLKLYFRSLDRVRELDVNMVLPGHRSIFSNLKQRCDELQQHHMERLEEILDILERGAQTGFDIASKMSWDIPASGWDDFPLVQKWFATGEALAHIFCLEEEGKVCRHLNRDVYQFRRI